VLGACLFPLAPNWAKIAVFYLSSGLLALLLGSLLLRGAVAAATWIVSGHTLWLLPNIMSEVGSPPQRPWVRLPVLVFSKECEGGPSP
jgi:hypothetical protein